MNSLGVQISNLKVELDALVGEYGITHEKVLNKSLEVSELIVELHTEQLEDIRIEEEILRYV